MMRLGAVRAARPGLFWLQVLDSNQRSQVQSLVSWTSRRTCEITFETSGKGVRNTGVQAIQSAYVKPQDLKPMKPDQMPGES